jgi:hypothetical protein
VLAGVAVIGLNHVAEHQRGPVVCVAELDQALKADAPFASEHRQQPDEREQRERRHRRPVDLLADDQGDA